MDGPETSWSRELSFEAMVKTVEKPGVSQFEDPVHGLVMWFGRESDAELEIFTRVRPGGELAEHFHIGIEERWEVLEGAVEIRRDGRWHRLTPGDGVFVVTPGQRHALRNRSGEEARLRTAATPPRNLREFILESARAAREGLFSRHGLPTSPRSLVWAIDFAWRFRNETVVCRPPPVLQRALLPAARRMTTRFRGA